MIDNINKKIKRNLLNLLRYEIDINDEVKSLSSKELTEIITISERHHIKEYLYYNLKKNDLLFLLNEEQLNDLQNSFKQKTFYNMSLLAEFTKISKILKKENISLIALKGLHLMQDIYPHIALRFSRDLDILVLKKDSKKAYECLKKLDYFPEKELVAYDFTFDYGIQLSQMLNKKNRFVIEIHAYIDDTIKISTDELFEFSNDNKLSLEDLIIHLCIHLCYRDLFKSDLRHYLDFCVLLEKEVSKINWDLVIFKINKYNCSEGVYLVFQILKVLFNIKIHEKIDTLYILTKERKKIIDNAIEFMWLYDKSSKDYTFYKSKAVGIIESKTFLGKTLFRVFIKKQDLAHIYKLDKNSKSIYIYYIIRLYDLIKNHSKNLLKINTDKNKKDFLDKTIFTYKYLNKI